MDIERTRAYYAALTAEDLCGCDSCRNFYQEVRAAYPETAAFLDGWGVAIEKPFESFPLGCREAGYEEYRNVQYVVFGGRDGFEPCEVGGVRIGLAESHPVTDIEEPHFVIELEPFRLDWTVGPGTLVGVGVGPGDPEMLTLAAVRAIREADLICLPQLPKETSRAYNIAVQAVPELAEKECVSFDFKMTRDEAELAGIHRAVYEELLVKIKAGVTIAFLTIGDPAVYSTFAYIADLAEAEGIPVRMISGITSFCGAAGALSIPLCERDEKVHILTGKSDMGALTALTGTKIIMKSGRGIREIKAQLAALEEAGIAAVYAVSNCGLPDERRFRGAAEIPEDSHYMTVIIVKDLR